MSKLILTTMCLITENKNPINHSIIKSLSLFWLQRAYWLLKRKIQSIFIYINSLFPKSKRIFLYWKVKWKKKKYSSWFLFFSLDTVLFNVLHESLASFCFHHDSLIVLFHRVISLTCVRLSTERLLYGTRSGVCSIFELRVVDIHYLNAYLLQNFNYVCWCSDSPFGC